MDLPSPNLSQVAPDEVTNNNNNVKPNCADDTNETIHSDFDEKECLDENVSSDSSDLVDDVSGIDQEDHSKMVDQVFCELGALADVEIDSESNQTSNDCSIPTMQKECHSIEQLTDVQTEQTENMNDFHMLPENCVSIKETISIKTEPAEEDEPIFDFLGKANEIVCYYFVRFHE